MSGAREQALLRRQKLLADFGDVALQTEDLDVVLGEACRLVAQALGTDRAKVLEIMDGGKQLLVRAGIGWAAHIVGRQRISMSERSSESYSIRVRKPVVSQDIEADERFDLPDFMKAAGVRALANVPIFLPGGSAYGLLQVDATQPRDFDEEDTQFLRTYATILGPIIDRILKLTALQSAEERFRLTVEEATDYAIFILDSDARVTDWLPGAARVFGWTADEAIGQPGSFVFVPEDLAAGEDRKEIAEARRDGVAADNRWHLRKDGSRVFIEGSNRALRDAEGRVTGFIKVGQDVTQRLEADDRLRENVARQAFLLALSDAIRPLFAPNDIKAATTDLLCHHLGADRIAYYEIDQAEYVVECNPIDGADSIEVRRAVARFGRALLDEHRPRSRSIVVPDIALVHTPAEIEPLLAMQTRAYIGVPLRADGRFIGGLTVHSSVPRAWSAADVTLAEETAERTWAALDRGRVETALRDSEERLRLALQAGTLATWDWNMETGKVTWSDEHYRQAGYEPFSIEPTYEAWLRAVHPDDRERAETALAQARDHVEPFFLEYRILWTDKTLHWAQAQGTFQYGSDGRPVRMIGVQRDITEAKMWEERQGLLLGELQHRTRNLMGIVRSIAEQTLRSSRDLADFAPKFRDRLSAIARVNGLLSRLNDADRVSFDELLYSELDALIGPTDREAHVVLDGPLGILLRSSTVQTFALALHELATNALKYGALSRPGGAAPGVLAVRWHLEREGNQPWLHVDWRESGVALAKSTMRPSGGGAGRELIERALPYQLNARTTFEMTADGVHCTIALPVSERTDARPEDQRGRSDVAR